MTVALVGFTIALLLAAIVAGLESGLYSAERLRLDPLARDGNRRMGRVLRHLQHPDRALAALLLVNNVAHALCARFADPIVVPWVSDLAGSYTALASALVVTPVLFVLGEIVPKDVFRRHPTRFLALAEPVLTLVTFVMTPVVAPFAWLVGKLAGKDDRKTRILLDRTEIETLLMTGADGVALTPVQGDLASAVLRLRRIKVRDRMVPWSDVATVSKDATARDVIEASVRAGKTRLPVVAGGGHSYLGYVVSGEARRVHPGAFRVESYLHTFPAIGAEITIAAALARLQREGRSLGFVVDSATGRTLGIISAADIVGTLLETRPKARAVSRPTSDSVAQKSPKG